MKSIRDSSVLSFAFVLLAEFKDLFGGLVVEFEKLAVGSKSIKDILAYIEEEAGSWLNVVLFF